MRIGESEIRVRLTASFILFVDMHLPLQIILDSVRLATVGVSEYNALLLVTPEQRSIRYPNRCKSSLIKKLLGI